DGEAVDVNTVLVKYTYNGDGNLDGIINADDFARIDTGFATHTSGYRNGDSNYSGGPPNADDYFLIDKAFIDQSSVLSGTLSENIAPAATAQSEPVMSRRARGHQTRRHHHRRQHERRHSAVDGVVGSIMFRRRD
ncbi:MAG TPA: hypothetical protein VGP94_15075, partial [Tepidisphaeraceae bacterium]|nr:hypothetical protein [Tepidisphaeraceae bacterium]